MKLRLLLILVAFVMPMPVLGQSSFDWQHVQAVAVGGYNILSVPGSDCMKQDPVYSIVRPKDVAEFVRAFGRKPDMGVYGCIPSYELWLKDIHGQVLKGLVWHSTLSVNGKPGLYPVSDRAIALAKKNACAKAGEQPAVQFNWDTVTQAQVIKSGAFRLVNMRRLKFNIQGTELQSLLVPATAFGGEIKPELLRVDGYLVLRDSAGELAVARVNLARHVLVRKYAGHVEVRWLSVEAVRFLKLKLGR